MAIAAGNPRNMYSGIIGHLHQLSGPSAQGSGVQKCGNSCNGLADIQHTTPVEEGEDIDLTLIAHILEQNQHIPIILENDRGGIDFARNFGEQKDTDKAFLKRELESMKSAGVIPDTIMQPGFSLYLYYKRSNLLLLLTYFPLIQVILVSAFLGLAYFGFNSLRQAEQNRVWIGMAKETAHQLGTPISAIIAWIEYLKSIHPEDERTGEVIRELGKDVNRLELVADRFSKIGSEPVLQNTDLYEVLEQCRVYMQPRSPRKVEYDFQACKNGRCWSG